MKIRHLDKLFEQMQFEVRNATENITRLAEDQARTEKQLEELWKHCFFLQKEFEIRNPDFASEPSLQKVRCDSCHCLTNKWKVKTNEHGYMKLVECVICYNMNDKTKE